MTLASGSFSDGGVIPRKHTCEGADTSPALSWSGVPPDTRSLALVVDDPDAPDPRAPRTTWVHWVVYNVPPDATGLPEADAPPAPAREGTNDFGELGWRGPCPPRGRHRYFFKLYALDAPLPELGPATKADVERAMQGRVLAQAHLVGTYQKGDR